MHTWYLKAILQVASKIQSLVELTLSKHEQLRHFSVTKGNSSPLTVFCFFNEYPLILFSIELLITFNECQRNNLIYINILHKYLYYCTCITHACIINYHTSQIEQIERTIFLIISLKTKFSHETYFLYLHFSFIKAINQQACKSNCACLSFTIFFPCSPIKVILCGFILPVNSQKGQLLT